MFEKITEGGKQTSEHHNLLGAIPSPFGRHTGTAEVSKKVDEDFNKAVAKAAATKKEAFHKADMLKVDHLKKDNSKAGLAKAEHLKAEAMSKAAAEEVKAVAKAKEDKNKAHVGEIVKAAKENKNKAHVGEIVKDAKVVKDDCIKASQAAEPVSTMEKWGVFIVKAPAQMIKGEFFSQAEAAYWLRTAITDNTTVIVLEGTSCLLHSRNRSEFFVQMYKNSKGLAVARC